MASIENIKIEIEAALIEENKNLREALRISTNGLRHCARWNISEEKEKALMTQVIANEALLIPHVQANPQPAFGPDNPPRLRKPGESLDEYRAAMGWSESPNV